MGSDCQHGAPNPVQRSGDGHRKGLCKGIEATQRGIPVFVGDAQLAKQSPVIGGGWSGVGGLAHSSCQLSPPQTQSWGWEEESEKRNTRAEGQASSNFYCW